VEVADMDWPASKQSLDQTVGCANNCKYLPQQIKTMLKKIIWAKTCQNNGSHDTVEITITYLIN
jgi:hypothetical protein